MTDRHRIAVVGASVAGAAAAAAARSAGYGGSIHLYDAETHLPYDKPPLSKGLLSGAQELASIALRSEREWSDLDVDLRLGQQVLGVGHDRTITTASGATSYDGIVLAPGTRARRSPFPIDPRVRAHILRTCDDAAALRTALRRAEHVVIVGGGFVGLEVASVVTGAGAACTVVEASNLPLSRAVGPDLARVVLERHHQAGCVFHLDAQVQRITVAVDGRAEVWLAGAGSIRADAVVLSIGVVPATDFLSDSGVELDDGICANAFGETSVPRIYACGDAVSSFSHLYQRRMRIEHWTTAREHGVSAASNLVADLYGRPRSPFLHVPYVWSDQLDMKIQTVGRLLEGAVVQVDHVDDRSMAVSFVLDGATVGGAAINRAREVMSLRRSMDEALRETASRTALGESDVPGHHAQDGRVGQRTSRVPTSSNPAKQPVRPRGSAAVNEAPITSLDPTAPGFLEDPYSHLDELRETTPVAWSPSMNRFVVTRHQDVFACQRNPSLGRSYRQRYTAEEFGQSPPDPRWTRFWQAERWSLLELEPPDHTRIRTLVSSAFTPKRVLALRHPAGQRSEELLTELRQRPTFDLLADYAQPYSVSIICELLGAERAHEELFLHWAHAMVKMYEVDTSLAEAEEADRAAGDFIAAAKDLIDFKRKHPADDLVSQLVQAEDAGETLTDDELVSTIIVLLNAGHEATVNTTGNGMTTMMRRPDQWDLVVSGAVQPRQAIEELIRFDPPLQLFERWVLDEVQVGGVTLPPRSRIAMLYGAANGDPRVFDTPRELDVTRVDSSRHVNFGGGIHACLGSPLARVELDATFTNLARLTPDLALVEEPERTGAFVIWGYQAVSVTSPTHAR